MAVGHDHQPFASVVAAGFALRGPRNLDDQRQTGEFVEGEEACVRRLGLHRQRRFQLEQVWLGVGHTDQGQGQLGERDRVGHFAGVDPLFELRAQRLVQRAEDEVVRQVVPIWLGRLGEIAGHTARQGPVQVSRDGCRPGGGKLARQQLRRPATEEHRAAAEA